MVGAIPHKNFAQTDGMFIRRLVVGLLVTLGTFEGLRHLVWATIPGETTEKWLPLFLTIGVWLGSFISGLAFQHGIWSGLGVGLATGLGFLGLIWYRFGINLHQLIEILLPPTIFGLMGGTIGRFVYRPAPMLIPIDANFTKNVARKHKVVPVIWWKIMLGAALITAGVYFADEIRFQLAWLMSGNIGGGQAGRFTTWAIGCICTLLGGILSGVGTKAGVKQGLGAGILASGILGVLIEKQGADAMATPHFWAEWIEKDPSVPIVIAACFVTTTLISAFAGYMGSTIFRKS